uniref:Uncharacterized protein n=1 Tax=Anguilla anguilla TaxID=7936 RepID=A0A0E9PGP5_ANGAN
MGRNFYSSANMTKSLSVMAVRHQKNTANTRFVQWKKLSWT